MSDLAHTKDVKVELSSPVPRPRGDVARSMMSRIPAIQEAERLLELDDATLWNRGLTRADLEKYLGKR